MVYALAAYSITLGVLALYWVLIQHRRTEVGAELARLGERPPRDPRKGFNVGAFLLAPVWMLGHGLPVPGALLLIPTLATVPLYLNAMWIPLLFVALVPVAAGAALGFVANRIAVEHTQIEQPGALSATQLPWALAGIVLYAVVLPWAWYFTITA